jgi:superfamily I DNA/RNA helicase
MVLAFNRAIVHEIRIRLRETFDAVGYGAMVRHVRVHTFHGLAAGLLRRVGDGSDLLGELETWLASPGNAALAADGLRAILVDEYQDVDSQREANLFRLQDASGASLFAIGDDDQDILGFTHADRGDLHSPGCGRFEQFADHFSLADDQRLQLRVNFRSCRSIVERSNNLIQRHADKNAAYRRLKTEPLSSASKTDGSALHSASRKELLNELKIRVPQARDDGRSIAVLCRTNDEVVEVAESLQNVVESIEIRTSDPYAVEQLRHFALFLDDVRDITGNEENPLLTDTRIDQLLKQWKQRAVPEATDGSPFGLPEDLVNIALKQNRFARAQDLLNVAAMKSDELVRILNREQTKNCVVSTIHRVKGLEFDEVVLIPSQAQFPFGRRDHQFDLAQAAAEEMRLFYVGMTRAQHSLLFGWAEREKAWWKGEKFAGEGQTCSRRRVLGGRLKGEVDIGWAGRSGCGERSSGLHRAVGAGW